MSILTAVAHITFVLPYDSEIGTCEERSEFYTHQRRIDDLYFRGDLIRGFPKYFVEPNQTYMSNTHYSRNDKVLAKTYLNCFLDRVVSCV